jgi:hypothetical protein
MRKIITKVFFTALAVLVALVPAGARFASVYVGDGTETPDTYAQGVGEGYYAGIVEIDDVLYADGGVAGDVTGDLTGDVTGDLDGIVGGTTPAAGTFTDLDCSAGAIDNTEVAADVIAKTATSNLDDLVASSTTRTMVFVATSNCVVTKAEIAFYTIPGSASGTVLGNLKAYDASGNAEHVLQETADLNLEGLTAKEGTAITLQTTNPEYLELDVGDTVYYESVSNNGDMTGGTDGALTLEITLD